jgi:translin
MDRFSFLSDQIHQDFSARNAARDKALAQTRQLIRLSANSIRAIHRLEQDNAREQLGEARKLVQSLKNDLTDYPDLFYAGYTQDALKEYAEASVTFALVLNQELPLPDELGLEIAPYLNGLAESVGELRRRCLDILRLGYSEDAERLLNLMDDIYSILVTIDYPDAITNGLRRQTDLARGIVERTRGDLTLSIREQRLTSAMARLSKQLQAEQENNAHDSGV